MIIHTIEGVRRSVNIHKENLLFADSFELKE